MPLQSNILSNPTIILGTVTIFMYAKSHSVIQQPPKSDTFSSPIDLSVGLESFHCTYVHENTVLEGVL